MPFLAFRPADMPNQDVAAGAVVVRPRRAGRGESPRHATGRHPGWESVTEPDYQEMIALSADPSVTSEDVRGQTASPESIKLVAEIAGALSCEASLETQIKFALGMPTHISARHLALPSVHRRTAILSHLSPDLAGEIVALLPVGVS